MTCANCQKDIAVGSRFCYNCGAKQPETPPPGLSPATGGKKKLMRSSTDKKIAGVCAGLADWHSYLLNKDEECARPERGAINLTRGPQVVGHQDEQEEIREQRRPDRISVNHGEGPTRDGGDHQCNRGDEDEAFVRRRIEAGPEGEKDQRRKNQHIRDGNDVKNFRIHVWIAATANERIGGRQYSKDYHETRQEEACNAEAAMDVHAAGGNQRGLR